MDLRSDGELVDNFLSGEENHFEELIQRHRKTLERFIFYRIGNHKDTEDIIQETLLSAWMNMDKLTDPERFKPWIIQIARNKCNDYFRSKQRCEEASNETFIEASMNKYGRSFTKSRNSTDVEKVYSAMMLLKEKDKVIIKLYYFDRMPITEIAQKLDIPEGTVKSRLKAARDRFRIYYSQNF